MSAPEQAQQDKGKAKGADGLTKKERRALKVAATGKPSNENEVSPKPEVKEIISATKTVPHSEKQQTKKTTKSKKPQEVKKEPLNAQEVKNEPLKAQEVKKKPLKTQDSVTKVQVDQDEAKGGNQPSKAELKAQRRAIQEAQRLAKLAKQTEPKEPLEKVVDPKPKASANKAALIKSIKPKTKRRIPFFNHLSFEKAESLMLKNETFFNNIHVAFLRLGVGYSSKTIIGSNARCLSLLSTLQILINDFTTPPKEEFCRSLESKVQLCVAHISTCRPMAVSMTNALKYFNLYLTQRLDTNLPDEEKRSSLLAYINNYIENEIFKAGDAISIQVVSKITSEDTILIYGCSSLITRILLDAKEKKFHVIIVDSRPLFEGKEALRRLSSNGIRCTYVPIGAISYVINSATKVLLGAHALLANGYVMSRTGTAQIALIAKAFSKPVLVCCETYKFSERAQTDAFVYNELGDRDKLVSLDDDEPLKNWQDSNCLNVLSFMYDITPPNLIKTVVTELAHLPCTSVPVVLRLRYNNVNNRNF